MKKAGILFGICVVLVAVLLGGLALLTRSRVKVLGSRLAADVRALEEDLHVRPSHVDAPDARSFGELLEPHVPALRATRAIEKDLTEADRLVLREVTEGKKPVSALTPATRKWLDAGRAGSAGALAATRSQSARHPEGMRLVSDQEHPSQQDGMLLLQTAAKIGAMAIRERLEAGDAVSALAICLDGAALGRDASHEMGILGPVIASAIEGILFEGCAAAIDRAPVASKHDAAARLRRVVEGFAPMRESMKQETIAGELTVFATTMSAKEREAFSPHARTMIGGGEETAVNVPLVPAVQRALVQSAWAELIPIREEMSAAMEMPRAERDARLAAVTQRSEASWNPIVRLAFPDYSRFDDRRRNGIATLELLARAAEADAVRAETGAWPTLERPTGDETGIPVVLAEEDVLVVTLPVTRDPSQPPKPPREARFTADSAAAGVPGKGR